MLDSMAPVSPCVLEIHDAHPTNSLMAKAGRDTIDYKYQAEMWVEDTKDRQGPDGPPVRWDLVGADGVVIARWVRQEDGSIQEVEVE